MPPLSPFHRTCLSLAIGASFSNTLGAATITVNASTFLQGSATDNACHLFEAIISANTDSPSGDLETYPNECAAGNGHDTIVFDVPSLQAWRYTMVITENVTITGAAGERTAINGIDGGAVAPQTMFEVYGEATAALTNVTFQNLEVFNRQPLEFSESAGVIRAKNATIYVDNSLMRDNRGKSAGAIYARNSSSIHVSNSTFASNLSDNAGGAITVKDPFSGSSRVTVENSFFDRNTAKGEDFNGGGAIYVGQFGSLLVDHSAFVDNMAGNGSSLDQRHADGGALSVIYGQATISNSTFSDNVTWDNGGAIYVKSGSLDLLNTTFTGNGAGYFGATETQTGRGGGIYTTYASEVTITNSIVSGNEALGDGQEMFAASGTLIPDAGNLFGHDAITTAEALAGVVAGASDITATSLGTQPTALANILDTTLTDNGGNSPTHALVVDSPAIDAGTDDDCPLTDQRGLFRVDRACDIGAFELNASPNDPRTQCYAINGAGSETVVFCL